MRMSVQKRKVSDMVHNGNIAASIEITAKSEVSPVEAEKGGPVVHMVRETR